MAARPSNPLHVQGMDTVSRSIYGCAIKEHLVWWNTEAFGNIGKKSIHIKMNCRRFDQLEQEIEFSGVIGLEGMLI